ncbi:MAG: hypothetical protein VW907_08330 [Opitutae bacterium]
MAMVRIKLFFLTITIFQLFFFETKANSENIKQIYQKMQYGPTNLKIDGLFGYANKRFKSAFKYDEKFFAFYLKDKNLFCIMKHEYSFNTQNIQPNTFKDFYCSDGTKIKSGSTNISSNVLSYLKISGKGITRMSTGSGGYLKISGYNSNGLKFLITADYVDFFGDAD